MPAGGWELLEEISLSRRIFSDSLYGDTLMQQENKDIVNSPEHRAVAAQRREERRSAAKGNHHKHRAKRIEFKTRAVKEAERKKAADEKAARAADRAARKAEREKKKAEWDAGAPDRAARKAEREKKKAEWDAGAPDRAARRRGKPKFGRDAALALANWAHDRRDDGVRETVRLRTGQINPSTLTRHEYKLERHKWTRRVLRDASRIVAQQEACKRNVLVKNIKHDTTFWENVARYIFQCYAKVGQNPPVWEVQQKVGFEL